MSLVDFVDNLNAEASAAGAWACAGEFFANQGLPWLCYGYTERNDVGMLAVPKLRSNVPQVFLRRWADERLCDLDPGVRHSISSLHCANFGSEFLRREDCNPAIWSYYWDLRGIGSYSVLTVPFRGLLRSASGFMDIGGALKAGEMQRYLDERQNILVLAAHYVDQRMVALDRHEDARDIGLTQRETECLQWLAIGLRNDRIAEREGISVATVRFHLNNARRKLSSATREQAMARAVSLGLIEP